MSELKNNNSFQRNHPPISQPLSSEQADPDEFKQTATITTQCNKEHNESYDKINYSVTHE